MIQERQMKKLEETCLFLNHWRNPDLPHAYTLKGNPPFNYMSNLKIKLPANSDSQTSTKDY
jgi:hypothetical protein